jgi:uncharacterized membrane protein
MDQGLAAIIVAGITAFGGVVVGFMQSFRKQQREAVEENRHDHAIVQGQLSMIYRQVSRIDDKLEKHLEQHEEGENSGQSKKRSFG